MNSREQLFYYCEHGTVDDVQRVYDEYYSCLEPLTNELAVKAGQYGKLDVLTWLLEYRERISEWQNVAEAVCENGHVACLELLMSQRDLINTLHLIKYACIGGHIAILEILPRCNPHSKKYAALFKHGHLDAIKWLYEKLPNQSAYRISHLSAAHRGGKLNVVLYLLEKFPDLHLSAANDVYRGGNLDLVKLALGHLEAPQWAMVDACRGDNPEIVKFLYERNPCSLNDLDIYVANARCPEIITLLVSYGATNVYEGFYQACTHRRSAAAQTFYKLCDPAKIEWACALFNADDLLDDDIEYTLTQFDSAVDEDLIRLVYENADNTDSAPIWHLITSMPLLKMLLERQAFDLDLIENWQIAALYDMGLSIEWFKAHLDNPFVVQLHDTYCARVREVNVLPPVLAQIVISYMGSSTDKK